VLPLLLQPLVENAVKHGIAPLRRGGAVRIVAAVDRGSNGGPGALRLVVEDTGTGAPGSEHDGTRGFGLGLASVEQRLALHYGGAARVSLRAAPGAGTTVEITLPLSERTPSGSGDAARGAGAPEGDDDPAAGAAEPRTARHARRGRRAPLAPLAVDRPS
jgi:K+-sensing histidine kinase KdpD